MAATNRKAPEPTKAPGASEQNELFDLPAFCPILPPRGSAAETALNDLMARDLTQIDWITEGKGWRLSAAIKQLAYLGWMPDSIMVLCTGWGRKIARYSLPAKAKQTAALMRQGGAV